jgi:hypothetical protein
MKHNFIETYYEFIINETLKTINIEKTYKSVFNELSLLNYNFDLTIDENKLKLIYNPIKTTKDIYCTELDYICNLFIDRFGWFPSTMQLVNLKDKKYVNKFNKEFLKQSYNIVKEITIIFEPKFDVEIKLPDKLYHLSIQQFNKNIIKNGISPKSKSKISNHLDRIYVCSKVDKCYNLINSMKREYQLNKFYNSKYKINDKWIIYEINTKNLDIKIYKDPNYDGGYYLVDNISPNRIKVYDEE